MISGTTKMSFLVKLFQHKLEVTKFLVYLIVFLVIIASILQRHVRGHVINNWSTYKHNPFIIPFAGLFRRDGETQGFLEFTLNNFKKVYWTLHKLFFTYLIKPVQYIVDLIRHIVMGMVETLNKFRAMAKMMRQMFKELVENVATRMSNSYAALQFYQAKLNDMVQRQKAMFQMIVYFAQGMKLTIDSLINGPIIGMVKFFPMYGILLLVLIAICMLCFYGGIFVKMFTCPICLICFQGDTPILLADKTHRPISKLRLGDRVDTGGQITSVMKYYIADRQCDVYDYHGTIVSGSHLVFVDGCPVRVEDAPDSRLVSDNPDYLYCVSNVERRLISGGDTYCDFYESKCPIRNTLALQLVIQALNQQPLDNINNLPDHSSRHLYEWGFHPDTQIVMNDGETKLIKDVNIGDRVARGGVVYGLIQHDASTVEMYQVDTIVVSGTQAIYDGTCWTRVYQLPRAKPVPVEGVIYSLVTDAHILQVGTTVLTDYLELCENHPVFNLVHQLNVEAVTRGW